LMGGTHVEDALEAPPGGAESLSRIMRLRRRTSIGRSDPRAAGASSPLACAPPAAVLWRAASIHCSRSAIVSTPRMTVKMGQSRSSSQQNYLSIEGAIGLMPLRCTLGHAASRCVSFE
jgi:hypothetical protein